MALHSHVGSFNFADPANIWQVYETLMNEVQNEATYICNKYKIHIEPIQFEWDKFLPTLEKDFPYLLNEVLSFTNNQLHQPISNIKSSIPNENRNQYNTVIANRTRTLTNLSPLATNINEACGYEHIFA